MQYLQAVAIKFCNLVESGHRTLVAALSECVVIPQATKNLGTRHPEILGQKKILALSFQTINKIHNLPVRDQYF